MRLGAVLSLAWFAVTGFSMPLVPLGMPTDQATPQQSSRQDAEESQQQLRQSQLSLDAGIGSNVVAGGVGLLGGSAVTFLTTKGKYYNLGGRVATRIYDEWQRKLGECYVKQVCLHAFPSPPIKSAQKKQRAGAFFIYSFSFSFSLSLSSHTPRPHVHAKKASTRPTR